MNVTFTSARQIPEPASLAILLLGAGGAALVERKRRSGLRLGRTADHSTYGAWPQTYADRSIGPRLTQTHTDKGPKGLQLWDLRSVLRISILILDLWVSGSFILELWLLSLCESVALPFFPSPAHAADYRLDVAARTCSTPFIRRQWPGNVQT